MFRFNFSGPDVEEDVDVRPKGDIELEWFPATEVFPSQDTKLQEKAVKEYKCGSCKLYHVDAKQTDCTAAEAVIEEAEKLHSDLVPAKYEGGLKIWECTNDLADYLVKNKFDLHGKQVLDLGCGAGILGILAIQLGASNVHFQDYNSSVITSVTIPNVALNSTNLHDAPSTRFFAGDWKSFADLLQADSPERDHKYDLILTSETIYNPDNYMKLMNVFKQCLAPGGNVYLAAKTNYFGVGGGTREFVNLLTKDGTLHATVCWKCSEGVQREILLIQFS